MRKHPLLEWSPYGPYQPNMTSSNQRPSRTSTDRSTEWSEYSWDEKRQKWATSRRNARGEKEYHYRDPEVTVTSQANVVPRSFGQHSSAINPSYSPPPSGNASLTTYSAVNTPAYTLTPNVTSGYGSVTIYNSGAPVSGYPPRQWNTGSTSNYDTNNATSSSTENQYPISAASTGQSSSLVRSDSGGSNAGYDLTQYNAMAPPRVGYASISSDYNASGDVAQDFRALSLNQQSTIPKIDSSYQQGIAKTYNPPPNSSIPETLDDRYQTVENGSLKKFWKIGRVFMTLWTEPARDDIDAGQSRHGSQISQTYLGSNVFSEIRRFVVVREGHGNCKCSPIHTYGGQATLKPNLPEPKQHAIIYTSPEPPAELWYTAENGIVVREELDKDPIKVRRELQDKEGDLGTLSRLNYSKVYTVENYARVLNIGMVEKAWLPSLNLNSYIKPPSGPIEKPRKHPPRPDRSKEDHSYKGKGKGKESERRHHRH